MTVGVTDTSSHVGRMCWNESAGRERSSYPGASLPSIVGPGALFVRRIAFLPLLPIRCEDFTQFSATLVRAF